MINTRMVRAEDVEVGDVIVTTITDGIETAEVVERRTGWAGIGREVRTYLTIEERVRPLMLNPDYLVAVVDNI